MSDPQDPALAALVNQRLRVAMGAKETACTHGATSFAPYVDVFRQDVPVARAWLPDLRALGLVDEVVALLAWGMDADTLTLACEGFLTPGDAQEVLVSSSLPTPESINVITVMGFNRSGAAQVVAQPFKRQVFTVKWTAGRALPPYSVNGEDELAAMVRAAFAKPPARDELAEVYELVADSPEDRRTIMDWLTAEKVEAEVPGAEVLLMSQEAEDRRRHLLRDLSHQRPDRPQVPVQCAP